MILIISIQSYNFHSEVGEVSNVNSNVNDVINVESAVKLFNGGLEAFDVLVNVSCSQCSRNDRIDLRERD